MKIFTKILVLIRHHRAHPTVKKNLELALSRGSTLRWK